MSTLTPLRALAPAKVNLGLFLGPRRESDGRHELATVMQSISLADELVLEAAPGEQLDDEVLCPGVPGDENLAARALREFRARTGWQAPPLRLTIDKRIPLAAGLGGGSADAAAALRLARAASRLGDEATLLAIAEGLGADVPAQVSPGRWLAGGAGERLVRLQRKAVALLHEELGAALAQGAPLPAATELLHNDLQRAAVSLRPEIAEALRTAAAAGGDPALLSGSGPTVIGLFAKAGDQGLALARVAEAGLDGLAPPPVAAVPVEAAFGEPQALDSEPQALS